MHASQYNLFVFEHLFQLTTKHIWTDNLICFKTGVEVPEIEELTLRLYSVSDETSGVFKVSIPEVESIDAQFGIKFPLYSTRL